MAQVQYKTQYKYKSTHQKKKKYGKHSHYGCTRGKKCVCCLFIVMANGISRFCMFALTVLMRKHFLDDLQDIQQHQQQCSVFLSSFVVERTSLLWDLTVKQCQCLQI